ncbi:MAG: hypothetical protein AAGD92_11790 [Pseudomonadota bacterium]
MSHTQAKEIRRALRPLTGIRSGTSGRFAVVLAVLTFIGAALMPVIVAYDDRKALENYEAEQADPVKILGFEVGRGAFEPPSESSFPAGRTVLAMIYVSMAGLGAIFLGLEALIFGPNRALAALGAGLGPAGIVTAALLTPWGLSMLLIVGLIFALALIGVVAVSIVGSGGC